MTSMLAQSHFLLTALQDLPRKRPYPWAGPYSCPLHENLILYNLESLRFWGLHRMRQRNSLQDQHASHPLKSSSPGSHYSSTSSYAICPILGCPLASGWARVIDGSFFNFCPSTPFLCSIRYLRKLSPRPDALIHTCIVPGLSSGCDC